MSGRWINKGKNNCTNYNYWCDKLAKNCGGCDEYAEDEKAQNKIPHSVSNEYMQQYSTA